MPGIKKEVTSVRFNNNKVTPDEMDVYIQYSVDNPSVDPTWFGTTAVGTSTQAKALVIINKNADYPRNVAAAVAAAAGSVCGGTWAINGKNQFGVTQSESIAIGTATGGGTVAGTKIFAQVTSGTFTFASGDPGNGTPRLGVAIGTSTTLQHLFGLPTKIANTSDVKVLNWINNGTMTTMNGGTISAQLSTTNHTFKGTAIVAITDRYNVVIKPTYNAENDGNPMANL